MRRFSLPNFINLIASAFLFLGYSTHSFATDPRSYINLPIDTQLTQFGVGKTTIKDSQDPFGETIEQENIIDIFFYRYAYYFPVAGQIGGVTLFGNYGEKYQADDEDDKTTGLTNPNVMFAWALFGSPALSKNAFKNYTLDSSLVISFTLGMPLVENIPDGLGQDRWSFKPEIAYNLGFGKATQLNFYLNTTVFTEQSGTVSHPKTFKTISGTLTEQPQLGAEAYISQNFSHAFWVSLGFIYNAHGELKGETDDKSHTLIFKQAYNQLTGAASLNLMLTRSNMLTLTYSQLMNDSSDDARKDDKTTDESTILLRWMYLFGGYS